MVKVEEYFEVIYGTSLELNALELDERGVNFVGRGSQNNGVVARVAPLFDIEPNPANTISVAAGGSVMESFFQEESYYSGFHIFCLKPRIKMTTKQLLFYCICLRANKFRYNYGRQANKTLHTIRIPSLEEIPDYVKSSRIPAPPNKTAVLKSSVVLPLTKKWEKFPIDQCFTIRGSRTTPQEELIRYGSGKFPYITTQATNNAVAGYYDFWTEEGGVITIDSAVLGFASYQQKNFSASDHVEKLIPKFDMNPYLAMFFVTLLNEEHYRYNYGRKASQARLRSVNIKLPTTSKGEPDFLLMESYIKSLPYSSNL